MKKYLFAIVLISFTTICMSQEVRYGVRAAINVSNLDFDPAPTFVNEHRNGFAFGGFVDYGFSENTSLLVELQWSAEGAKENSIKAKNFFPALQNTEEGEQNISLRADYLKLPILLRLSLSDCLTVGAGPQLALKTWSNEDAFRTFTFSGVAGLEYMITDELFVDARFSFGLNNVLDEDFGNFEAKNNVLQIGFGMKI